VQCVENQQGGGGGQPAPDPDPDTNGGGGTNGGSGGQGTDQNQNGSGGGTQQNDSQSDPNGRVDQSAGTGRTRTDLDCVADFDSQEAAQEVLDSDTNDPFLLDADGDGVACENLSRDGVVLVRRVARVELARTGPHALWIGLAGGLCLAGGLTLRRGHTDS